METNLFEKIGRNSSKIYFIFDLDTRAFTYLNESVARVFEGDPQRFLNQPAALLDAVHPDDRLLLMNCFNKLLQGKPVSIECRVQHTGSANKVLFAEAYPIYDEGGKLTTVAGTAEDITERVEYVQYLMEFGRKKNSALEILAHDLRGPLSMVQSVANSLETDLLKQNYPDTTNYTHFIGKACETCINLIGDVLSEEHLKSPTIAVKKERVDMVEKVREVVELFAMNKSITQSFSIHTPPVAFAMADIVKIDQILNNLISNSIKFTAPDGAISITIELEADSVLLKHADNGIGIPRELLPFLFEKYTRAARSGLHGEETRGIGLSIVKHLVDLQGGEIWCESEENNGTIFYIRLPLAE